MTGLDIACIETSDHHAGLRYILADIADHLLLQSQLSCDCMQRRKNILFVYLVMLISSGSGRCNETAKRSLTE